MALKKKKYFLYKISPKTKILITKILKTLKPGDEVIFGTSLKKLPLSSKDSGEDEEEDTEPSLTCYRCGKQVDLDELIDVDEKINSLNEEDSTLVSDEFVHCQGSADQFHDEGVVNCCQACLDDIIGSTTIIQPKPDDPKELDEIKRILIEDNYFLDLDEGKTQASLLKATRPEVVKLFKKWVRGAEGEEAMKAIISGLVFRFTRKEISLEFLALLIEDAFGIVDEDEKGTRNKMIAILKRQNIPSNLFNLYSEDEEKEEEPRDEEVEKLEHEVYEKLLIRLRKDDPNLAKQLEAEIESPQEFFYLDKYKDLHIKYRDLVKLVREDIDLLY